MNTSSPTIVVYGIKNCDTIKKACRWLNENQLTFQFHDFRKDGINLNNISFWLTKVPAEKLLNKRGTTWRKLDDKTQQKAETNELAQLLTDNPTLIKRPILEYKGGVTIGFNEELYTALFS